MHAIEQTGYLYTNVADVWPSFTLNDVSNNAGSLELAVSGSSHLPAGTFLGGPFTALDGETPWFRVVAECAALPEGAHLQLYTFTAASGAAPYAPATNTPFPGWQSGPMDTAEMIVTSPPGQLFWVGGLLRGGGAATPSVRQIRIEYGRDTYINRLPGIYRADDAGRDFLERFLSLNGSVLGGLDQRITGLSTLLDAFAAPATGFPSWLGWLSGFLAFQLNQGWAESDARAYLAEAFALYGRRGTVGGLKRYLKMYAGVNATIVEPGLGATVWLLGENSTLGISTMLAPGPAGGAIVGSTAILDRSHMLRADDKGASLFDDLAHRFCVQIHCGELKRPGALADARAIVESEKPAHTVAHVCLIQPRMRVGAQARVGIDTVVGDGLPPAQLGIRLDGVTLASQDRDCHKNKEA
jgi:phage tail-like protein